MTIGLILLAIVAVLIFFGLTERFFLKLGLKNWLAFVLVALLIVGAIVPAIHIGDVFSVSLGGFLVPLVIMVVFFALMRNKADVFRTFIAIMAVASVAVATRVLIEPENAGLILVSSLIVGFVGGAAAFLAGQTRLSSLAAVAGGIILGDVITNFLYRYIMDGYDFRLGSYGVFDSIIIATVFAVILVEGMAAIKRATSHHRTKSTALNMESAEDVKLNEQDSTNEVLDAADLHETRIGSNDFFDEYL